MSKLPIKDPRVRIIPSKPFQKFIADKFSQKPCVPERIQSLCRSKFKGSNKGEDLPEVEPVKFTEDELKFLAEQASESGVQNSDPSHRFEEAGQDSLSEEEAKDKQSSFAQTLSLNDLKWLHQALNTLRLTDPDVPYLHELIRDCELVLPENEILERNAELEARCKQLRKEQEAREYEAMTRNVDNVRTHMPQDTIAFQMKQINRQLIAVAQFIFSVAAGFAFGFIGIELIVGQLDFGFRLLLGIMIALIIALAEIYFLAKKLNEEYDSPQTIPEIGKEKGKVVETIRIAADSTTDASGKLHKD